MGLKQRAGSELEKRKRSPLFPNRIRLTSIYDHNDSGTTAIEKPESGLMPTRPTFLLE
ncbi:hypothetical protein [Paenibacillus lautus]|uniref:hypothetical protein n=1 Tax=Paenibacillus lautus TaxID=1401 RepID=UPI001C7CB24F|nr:hypothetical protein [Paenibacillus lautus]